MSRLAALALALLTCCSAASAEEVRQLTLRPARYADAREALVDAVESEGLVPAPPSQFGDMLRRTGAALDENQAVYAEAEVLHFCSARIAWQLARENPANIARCPLSMALYTLPGEQATVHLAWRETPGDSAGMRAANQLLQRIAAQTADNAGRSGLGR